MSSHVHAKVTPSNAIKGMTNHIFSFDEISTHKNLTAFWFGTCENAIRKGSRV